MDNYMGSFIQFSYGKPSKTEDMVKIHQKKIIPKREDINSRREQDYENEWQQEYFIIYNSYVLDENDMDE